MLFWKNKLLSGIQNLKKSILTLFGFTRAEWIMLSIVVLAFLLRLNTLQGGLHTLFYPGEKPIIQTAIMFLKGSVLSEWWITPPPFIQLTFYSWIQGIGAALTFLLAAKQGIFRSIADINPTEYWRFLEVGRFITTLMGTFSIWLVYLIGKKLANAKTGILAALILALIPLHIEYSCYLLPIVPATFLALLAFWLICSIIENKNTRNFILAGLFGGLATATQFSFCIILIPLLVASWMNIRNNLSQPKKKVLIGITSFGGGFLLGSPFIFLNLPFFISKLSSQAIQWRLSQISNQDWIGHLVWAAGTKLGIVTILFFVIATLNALYHHSKIDILLLCFLVPFILIMGRSFDNSPHMLLPILPFLCILTARSLFHNLSSIKWKSYWIERHRSAIQKSATALMMTALVYYASVISLTVRGITPTQLTAENWIVSNIPTVNSIASEKDTPKLNGFKRFDSSWALGTDNTLDWYKENKYAVILVAENKAMNFSSIVHPGIHQFRRDLEKEGVLLKEFSPSILKPGPKILIYQVLPLI